ncbi:MAG: hypothetical protein HY840_08620 [Bacteroidetes bacterium]|nr:hypothetical protein [Bacteroidota bacterium]
MKKQIEKLPDYSLWRFEKKSSYEHIDNYPIVYLIQVQEWCITKMRYVIYATKDGNSIEKIRRKYPNPNNEKFRPEFNLEIHNVIEGKNGKEYQVIKDQHEAEKKFGFYYEQNDIPYFSLPGRPTGSFVLLKEWYATQLNVNISWNTK